MKIKSIRNVKNLAGKRVLLRADFNVPIIKKTVTDNFKIIKALPTIRFLLRYRSKIIIITHLNRPGGKRNKKYSAKPIARYLAKLLGKEVKFVDNCIGSKVSTEVEKIKNGEILLLENLRFHNGEETNSKEFAKKLASLGDICVNNAFAVSHRKHASVSAIKKYLPVYAGILLEDEINNLNIVLNPQKPLIIVLGGAKIATKISLIKKLNKKAFRILIGGALANNFLVAHKLEIGKSLVDKKSIKSAKNFKNKNILLPIDVVISKNKYGKGRVIAKSVNQIKKDEYILDIGPETIKLYNNFIKKAKTIIWNGPMGLYENEHFKHGTLALARVIATRSTGKAFGVVGGGETVEALRMTKMEDYIDWVSTGGGAMLAYLGGEKMPGLTRIVK